MKEKSIVTILVLFLSVVHSFAQTKYQKNYYGPNSIDNSAMTRIGNELFIVGDENTSPANIIIVNSDLNGNLNWEMRFSSTGSLGQGQVIEIGLNKYLIGTNNMESPTSNIFIAKINSIGQVEWSTLIDDVDSLAFSKAFAINNSEIILTGNIKSGSNQNIFVSKVDTSGNLIWSKSIGATGNETINSAIELSNGSILLTGLTDSYDVNGDILIVKLSSTGQIMWSYTYDLTTNSHSNQIGFDVMETSNNELFVCGKTKTFQIAPNNEQWAPVVLKLDSSGSLVFFNRYDLNSGNSGAYKIKERNSNEFIFVGEMGNTFALLTSINSAGITNWSYFYSDGFVAKSSGRELEILSNGYIFSGNMYGTILDSLLLNRTDLSGQSGCFQGIPSLNGFGVSQTPIVALRTLSEVNTTSFTSSLVITESIISINTKIFCELIVSVTENELTKGKIYPNPVKNNLFLKNFPSIISYAVYNSNGKLIIRGNNDSINLEKYTKGIYFLSVTTKDEVLNYKIIKN